MCRADVGGSILRRSLDHVIIRNASCIVISARGLSHESGVNESLRWQTQVEKESGECSICVLLEKLDCKRKDFRKPYKRNYGNVTVEHKETTMGVYISNFLDFFFTDVFMHSVMKFNRFLETEKVN